MIVRCPYESSDELFRDFSDDPAGAADRVAAHYSVLPEIVLATVQQLEATHRAHPRAIGFFDSELGAFKRADLVLRDLRQRVGLRTEGARILDIGCGGGHAIRAAWACGAADVRGLELDACRAASGNEMLQRFGLPASIVAGSIFDPEAVAALGGEYDSVLIFDLLEHVPSVSSLLAVVRTLLKGGGIAVIRVGNPFNPELLLREPHYGLPGMTLLPRDLALEYFRCCASGEYEVFEWLSRDEVEKQLRAAGFAVEAVPQEKTHPLSDFDRVAAQLTEATDYPTPQIAAEVRRRIRLLQRLRQEQAEAADHFGVMIHTIVGRAGGVAGVEHPQKDPADAQPFFSTTNT
jgi:2-polyprenyl-3-methyl-5-hydroxy-6-metoxy-1,4-benzoquinol methylase